MVQLLNFYSYRTARHTASHSKVQWSKWTILYGKLFGWFFFQIHNLFLSAMCVFLYFILSRLLYAYYILYIHMHSASASTVFGCAHSDRPLSLSMAGAPSETAHYIKRTRDHYKHHDPFETEDFFLNIYFFLLLLFDSIRIHKLYHSTSSFQQCRAFILLLEECWFFFLL